MKKALAIAFLIALPLFASAHTFKAFGNTSVMMHVNPNDDPIAGEQSNLIFLVSYKDDSVYTCTCKVQVVDGGKTIFSAPFTGSDTSIPYIFPHPGVYQLVIAGTDNASSTFNLSFDQRVEKAANATGAQANSTRWILYVCAGLAVLLAALVGLILNKRNK